MGVRAYVGALSWGLSRCSTHQMPKWFPSNRHLCAHTHPHTTTHAQTAEDEDEEELPLLSGEEEFDGDALDTKDARQVVLDSLETLVKEQSHSGTRNK